MSATQSSFGRAAAKSRRTRSGRRAACGSERVVRHGLPRRLAPTIPLLFISRCTRQRGTCSPARRNAFHIRRYPVGVVVGRVQLADPGEQPLVLDRSRRPAAAGALVVRGRRHAQGPTDRLDPEAATVLVDVAAHFGRSGSSSLAKNTLADFRISFARRSSKFSCRSRLISSRSSLVGRSGVKPWSASAWRTRLRSVSGWMPRSAATCAIGRSLSSASRTPRSSNSTGYFLGLDMTAENLLSPGQHPGSKVPAKPGPAHNAARRKRLGGLIHEYSLA